MAYRKKRGDIWYVYWRENGKLKGRAVSPDLQAAKNFERELENRLYAKKNGIVMENVRFDELCDDYIKNFSKINKKSRTIAQKMNIL